MIVTDLFIYPIKSCQGISLTQAQVTPQGFLGDREFMLVDLDGHFLSQRQYPQLATVRVDIVGESLYLTSGSQALIFQPTFSGKLTEVVIWRDKIPAIAQGDEVAQWFASIINKPCRLVRQWREHIRPVDPTYAKTDKAPVSLADGYPYLLTATASLAEVNRRLRQSYPGENQEIPMNRFRPNIVIATQEPFVEGQWTSVQIGRVIFSLVKPCSRCLITTTDQQTGERNSRQEPLTTLKSFRQFPKGIMFGENMIPQTLGQISLGDEVRVIYSESI
jgi:hypothetical protein